MPLRSLQKILNESISHFPKVSAHDLFDIPVIISFLEGICCTLQKTNQQTKNI